MFLGCCGNYVRYIIHQFSYHSAWAIVDIKKTWIPFLCSHYKSTIKIIFTFSAKYTAKKWGAKTVKINLGTWINTIRIPRNNGNFYLMLHAYQNFSPSIQQIIVYIQDVHYTAMLELICNMNFKHCKIKELRFQKPDFL